MKIRQLIQRPRTDQTVIRVIVHNLRAHPAQQLVIGFRRKTFEKCIRRAVGADTVYDLRAIQIRIHHFVHRRDIILPVAVNGNRYVAVFLCLHQAGQHGILVAAVAALRYADIMRVFPGKLRDNLPGPVIGPVIDIKNPALIRNFAGRNHFLRLPEEKRCCDRQHLFFVIARNNNPKDRFSCTCFHRSSC